MRLRLLLLSPLLILLVVFALSNTMRVPISLWPTGMIIEAPLSIVVLLGMAAAFLFGAVMVWFGALIDRRRAHRAETRVAALETELAGLRNRVKPASDLPPPQ